jgi:hypothetical protein
MEPPRPSTESDEVWRLGVDPETLDDDEPDNASPATELSGARLQRPIAVLTVEHLAWLSITTWTLLMRLSFLDARPLNPAEAGNALFAYDLAFGANEATAVGFHPAWSGWIHLLQAGIFAACGAGDVTARLLFALSGLLLVTMSFELHHYAGRAGAIAIGAILALSPTATWFSRATAVPVVSAAFAVVVISLFMTLQDHPSRQRAAALGLAAGLMVAAGPSGCIIAATLIGSLALLGIGVFCVTKNAGLRSRVWLDRYAGRVVIVAVTAAAVCLASQRMAGLPLSGLADAAAIVTAPRAGNFAVALRVALLPLGFYEFMLLLASAAGAITVLAMRNRTRFARFALIWTALSFAFYLSIPDPERAQILVVILPAAILSGVAIEYLHHSQFWGYGRYLIAAIAILTVYEQIATNFIHSVPDASEATWARHANLYWGKDATTIETAREARAILTQLAPGNLTVFIEGSWPPALRWCLRSLRPVGSIDQASVVIDTNQPRKLDLDPSRTVQFDYSESWIADPAALDERRALRFFFLQQPWGDVVMRSAEIAVREYPAGSAPTLILPPAP